MKQKRYNQEFKQTIVELHRSGTPVSNLSSEYGISEVTIYKWIKTHSPIENSGGLTPSQIAEIQKENLRLQQEVDIPKKGYDHIRKKVTDQEIIDHIEKEKEHFPIQLMCDVLKVPRSTYYQSFHKVKSSYAMENEAVLARIQTIHAESKGRYGAPKIHYLLTQEKVDFSLNRVQRIMKKAGIRSTIVKKYRPTSSTGQVVERENLLEQNFETTTINEKWVADITYIHTLRDGWCYLASVLDLHTKKIVGYSFSKSMTTELVLQALANAIDVQQPEEGLILHTDLGSQYTSEDFEKAVKEAKFKQSFSRKGCPYDNACIESFHAILKKEEVYQSSYINFETARLTLFHYIESWYNRKRIHGAINYLTPQQLEDLCRKEAV
ncbi:MULTISPECIES: IS3 family transposase [unclassified Psychrobacillus]|uniref:IS3 family transposase n=1 Tax=unclassified Psychrobacillus TaxID=2636677 RepID=UPI00146D8FDF|nr:IS3 family transposase [Psychrobacillus sp. BL-248-WT-3]NME07869.1 IS3 family transposase [Psychrobacillus sp. BL-248-WT-3]